MLIEQADSQVRTWIQKALRGLGELPRDVEVSLGAPRPNKTGPGLSQSEIIELVPVTLALARLAAGLVAGHRIRGCNAVYVAMADQLGDCLVKLDRQQLERGAAVVDTREP